MPETDCLTPSQPTTLLEITFSESPRVDRETGIIRGVKILGRQSQNGRIYSDTALEESARIYEGIGVNIDHSPVGSNAVNRNFADGFGYLKNIQRREAGVYGDLVYLKSHSLAEQICEAAERMPEHFGLSHHAEGTVVRQEEVMIVDHISHVHSVDIVRNPATNKGLFESHWTADPTLPTSTDETVQELRETIGRLEAEIAARTLLESSGVKSSPTRLKALAAMSSESEQRALLKSWQPPVACPPRSSEPFSEAGSRNVVPADASSFARAIR